MTIQAILADTNAKMNKAVDVAKEDFAAIRTGRAHPSMFAKIMVDYYGTQTPLSQLSTVQVPEARMALITPFDKGATAAIEKAIRESDLGVNPGGDGNVIRVNFPQLTNVAKNSSRSQKRKQRILESPSALFAGTRKKPWKSSRKMASSEKMTSLAAKRN